MAADNLRRFVFLDKGVVVLETAGRVVAPNLRISAEKNAVVITSVADTAGSESFLYILEAGGNLHIVYRPLFQGDGSGNTLESYTIKAFEYEALFIAYCAEASVLIVLGKNDESNSSLKFNVYSVNRRLPTSKPNELCIFKHSLPVFSKDTSETDVALVAWDTLDCASLVAVGTETGSVHLYFNYIIPATKGNQARKNGRVVSIKLSDHYQGSKLGAVKGIHLLRCNDPIVLLYVFCEDGVCLSFTLSSGALELVSHQVTNSSIEATCLLPRQNLVAVAKSNGTVEFYGTDGSQDTLRGAGAEPLKTPKVGGVVLGESFGGELALKTLKGSVSRRGLPSYGAADAATSIKSSGSCCRLGCYKNYLVEAGLDDPTMLDISSIATLVTVKCIIPDMPFIAHSQYIAHVYKFQEALGALFVVAHSGSTSSGIILFQLRDKPIIDRLEILIRKCLFDWAIKLAVVEHRPRVHVEDIHGKYADWLYAHRRIKESVSEYCKAGESVEPAYVIHRFLPYKSHLFSYLLHLHGTASVNVIHTALLIRCFQALYKGDGVFADAEEGNAPFEAVLDKFLADFGTSHREDIIAALHECRASGGFEFAKLVTKKLGDDLEYINILIQDYSNFDEAIEHLNGCKDLQAVVKAISLHGRRLMHYKRDAMVALIQKLCQEAGPDVQNLTDAILPLCWIHGDLPLDIFDLQSGSLNNNNKKRNAPFTYFTAKLNILLDKLESSLRGSGAEPLKTPKVGGVVSGESLDDSLGGEVSLKTLKGSVSRRGLPSDGAADAATTIEEIQNVENQLWKLLNSNTQHADCQMLALILCLVYRYKRGANAMAIKMGYYHLPLVLANVPRQLLLQHDPRDDFNLLEYTLHYGCNEPTLWVGALSILARVLEPSDATLIVQALQHVQNYKVLSFPSVLAILKNHQSILLKHVKGYLKGEFQAIQANIIELQNDMQQDISERLQMQRDIQNLKDSYLVINNTNCSRCEIHLEVPTLVYFCKHSYHNYCVGANKKCQKCAFQENKGADHQDSFYKFLSGSTNPYDYVSQQLERFNIN